MYPFELDVYSTMIKNNEEVKQEAAIQQQALAEAERSRAY